MVDADGAEILADGLQRAAEDLGDAVKVGSARRWRGPEIEQRLHAGNGGRTRGRIGDKGGGGLVEILAETLVVGEEEGVVGSEGAAGGSAELVALERWSRALVEEIGRVERAIANKFKDRAMPLIAAELRDDDNLAAGMLAEFGAIGVALHIKFAHGVHAEQHAAGAAGLHIVFGGAGILNAIEEKEILLRAIALDGKIIASGGIRDAGATGLLRSEIDDPGIEREEEVEAAAVEREFFNLPRADEAGDVVGCSGNQQDIGIDLVTRTSYCPTASDKTR